MVAKAPSKESPANPNHAKVSPQSIIQSQPIQDIMESARQYARTNPEAAALWCFGIGFVLAWKIKRW